MIHAILEAGGVRDRVAHLIVLYTADNNKIYPGRYTRDDVEKRIAARVQTYLSPGQHGKPNARFFSDWQAVLPHIQIQFLTWEDVLTEINSDELNQFYDLCVQFNHS